MIGCPGSQHSRGRGAGLRAPRGSRSRPTFDSLDSAPLHGAQWRVVPPPAVNAGLGGRKATWNARVAAAHEGDRHRDGN